MSILALLDLMPVSYKFTVLISVSGFHSDFPPLSNVLADVAVAYNCPYSYQTYILFFNQVLLIKKMKHHLLNPDQLDSKGAL